MIWCVEDDATIRDVEVYALKSTGFDAKGFEDGISFWNALQMEQPQLVVLDVMLPGIDGVELLRRIRSSEVFEDLPVIMATAKGDEFDKVQSLDLGADDYLVKPFGVMELISRVRAVLRRYQHEPKQEKRVIIRDGLQIDLKEHVVTIDGNEVVLTYKEFELLRFLAMHAGTLYSREEIFESVWGTEYSAENRTMDVHMRRLRQKLGEYGDDIETVRNVGYRMVIRP